MTYKICSQLEQITYPNLPLAVYREIAAHLRQVPGVETALIPQQSQQFDYGQSQVECLQILYEVDCNCPDRQPVERILNYYARIYGNYQRELIEV